MSSNQSDTRYERSVEEFAEQIENIEETSGRNDKKDIVFQMTEESLWKQKIAILAGQEFDNIGVGQATAVKAVSRAFALREPTVEQAVEDAGTVTEAVRDVLNTSYDARSDRLDELYDDIVELEDYAGDNLIERLSEILTQYTVPWLVTFAVLQDLNTGVTHNTICMAAGEPRGHSKDDIRRGRAIYHESVNFVKQVRDGMPITEPSIFRPFKPMKAKSKDPPEDTSDWLAQAKLDGYRCTIHVKNGNARAFSANVKEQTDVLPELDEIEWPMGEWIFDAEVVADDGEYVSTKERMQRDPSSTLPHTMNFWVFDVIMAEGRDISTTPFEERMDILFEELPADERLVPVHAFEDIQQAMKEADRHGYEGLILKHRTHEVQFGQRSSDWLKDKITNETVDLRVAGFEQGTERNSDVLGALELETEDGTPMGNVGTGFSDRQRREIWENQDDWDGAVVEIAFDVSEGYEDGLRFPAFEGRRMDKDTADDLDRLRNIAGDE